MAILSLDLDILAFHCEMISIVRFFHSLALSDKKLRFFCLKLLTPLAQYVAQPLPIRLKQVQQKGTRTVLFSDFTSQPTPKERL